MSPFLGATSFPDSYSTSEARVRAIYTAILTKVPQKRKSVRHNTDQYRVQIQSVIQQYALGSMVTWVWGDFFYQATVSHHHPQCLSNLSLMVIRVGQPFIKQLLKEWRVDMGIWRKVYVEEKGEKTDPTPQYHFSQFLTWRQTLEHVWKYQVHFVFRPVMKCAA